MKSVLLLNASPFGENARGYQLALQAISNLQAAHPGIDVIERDLAPADFGRVTPDYARAIISRVAHDSPAFFQSERLIRELEETDALIISTPMHNYTVPAVLKLWIDLVLRAGRSFGFRDGRKVGLLDDRPTVVIVASGGTVTGKATQPNHLTGYLADVLGTIGITNLRFIHVQGLAEDSNAALSLSQGQRALDADPRFGRGLNADVSVG